MNTIMYEVYSCVLSWLTEKMLYFDDVMQEFEYSDTLEYQVLYNVVLTSEKNFLFVWPTITTSFQSATDTEPNIISIGTKLK